MGALLLLSYLCANSRILSSCLLKPLNYSLTDRSSTVELGLFHRRLARIILIEGSQAQIFDTKLNQVKLGALDSAHPGRLSTG